MVPTRFLCPIVLLQINLFVGLPVLYFQFFKILFLTFGKRHLLKCHEKEILFLTIVFMHNIIYLMEFTAGPAAIPC